MAKSASNIGTRTSLSLAKGGLAGCIATAPMTLFMLLTQRFLPRGQRYELPPEIITHDLARRANLHWKLSKRQILLVTTGAHFGYGATMGALYSPVEQYLPHPSLAKGSLFGLLVWGSSYLLLLPALGLVESAYREPGRRNAMMFVAHLIWGGVTGLIASRLLQDEQVTGKGRTS